MTKTLASIALIAVIGIGSMFILFGISGLMSGSEAQGLMGRALTLMGGMAVLVSGFAIPIVGRLGDDATC